MEAVTGLHRKRLTRTLAAPSLERQPRRRQRGRTYGLAVRGVVATVWESLVSLRRAANAGPPANGAAPGDIRRVPPDGGTGDATRDDESRHGATEARHAAPTDAALAARRPGAGQSGASRRTDGPDPLADHGAGP